MKYDALVAGLIEYPFAKADATSVSVAETVMGPVYCAELVVGVAPLVV